MNAEEDYGFDVSGYLHLPHVLSAAEVLTCNQAIEAVGSAEDMLNWPAPHSAPFQALLTHPVLSEYLEALCGAGFTVDDGPSLVADGPEGTAGVPLTTGPSRIAAGCATPTSPRPG